jgi:hypothetical protein
MDKTKPYPIPPTNSAFSHYTEIDVPILIHSHDTAFNHQQKQAIHFNERMRVLDFYLVDASHDVYESRYGGWHLWQVTARYKATGEPFHFFGVGHYVTREEAILVAQLANWFKDDEPALEAILVHGVLGESCLTCEISGKYGRGWCIDRLHLLQRLRERRG